MKKLILFPLLGILISCTNPTSFDQEKATQEILKLHTLQRDYHFHKDSISFANQLSDNFISVNKGVITRPSKKEIISRYHQYFSTVDFEKWDDVTPPIIRFSDDGNLAYTLVDKLVRLKDTSTGEPLTRETHFAWTAIYKKYGNQWKIDCVTSTEKVVQ